MITALDTNILLDIFTSDPQHLAHTAALIEKAADEGSLIICEVVYAELAPRFPTQEQLDEVLKGLGIELLHTGREGLFVAGQAWRSYRSSGGQRDRVLADFIIGAHAMTSADRLLTRDRGFYRHYFSGLHLLE